MTISVKVIFHVAGLNALSGKLESTILLLCHLIQQQKTSLGLNPALVATAIIVRGWST